MKIAYLSHTQLSDVDISFLQEAQKTMDITYYLEITPRYLKGAAINLKECHPKSGVFNADIYPWLSRFRDIIDFKRFRIVNSSGRLWSLKAVITSLKLYRELRRNKYDVIHVTWPLNFYELVLYLLSGKMVLTVHDPLPHSGKLSVAFRLRRYLAFHCLKNFIILNKKQKQAFIEKYRLQKKNVFESSLGCYSYLPQLVDGYRKDNKKSILFFGRITEYKGLDFLFPAFEQVHISHPDVTLVVAGGGTYYFEISQYQNKNYFRILNRFIPDEELADLIRNAEFAVCPYKDATQSGVAMSAFAFYKPIVATKVGGLPEMLGDGKYGILIPPCDANSLASAINNLLENKELLEELSRNIEEDYSWGNRSWNLICKAHKEIYNSIV